MDTPGADREPILAVRELVVCFSTGTSHGANSGRSFRAVDGVSLSISRGRTLGLVGESGSGKTTVGRAILRLIPITSGSIVFDGLDLVKLHGRSLRRLRPRMQVVFQDPGASLNPRMRVGEALQEPLFVHRVCTDSAERRSRVARALEQCGMPADAADRYPHQFSGGQRQRISIARALVLSPSLLVCDEPTSALDVSVQAQIINLLTDLQARLGLTLLFISHDINVIQHVCDRIAVMHRGRIVEVEDRDRVLTAPADPYTRRLLAAVPVADPRFRRLPAVSGSGGSQPGSGFP